MLALEQLVKMRVSVMSRTVRLTPIQCLDDGLACFCFSSHEVHTQLLAFIASLVMAMKNRQVGGGLTNLWSASFGLLFAQKFSIERRCLSFHPSPRTRKQ